MNGIETKTTRDDGWWSSDTVTDVPLICMTAIYQFD